MIVNVHSAKCVGIEAVPVTVEVDITPGIGVHLVGLADIAVKESLLRTVTAIQSIGYRIPGKRIVINLAPADLHKKGSGYDLPIALGIIAASEQAELPAIGDYLFLGELSLDGKVRSVQGALPVVEMARDLPVRGTVLPLSSATEAADYPGRIYAVDTLLEVLRIAAGEEDVEDLLIENRLRAAGGVLGGGASGEGASSAEGFDGVCSSVGGGPGEARGSEGPGGPLPAPYPDFAEIYGQEVAKRGLEIAAGGCHNVLMVGAPGAGKSSLAKALAGILPEMSREESLQTSKIYSVAGISPVGLTAGGEKRAVGLIRARPFRQPHYTSSPAALLGGGSDSILPGEVSLAHNGVLFLDEFCEAPKRVTEALRGPLEDRKVCVSRLRSKVEFPASFMLVAATNPCPCGYYGEGNRCVCTEGRRRAYLSKLSGPMMDRIDIQLWLHPVEPAKLMRGERCESSAQVAQRVAAARAIQRQRFAQESIFTNAGMGQRLLRAFCPLDEACREFLEKLMEKMGLSARACTRIIKLARTIADLEMAREALDKGVLPDSLPETSIRLEHLAEAANYRFLDRQELRPY
ncbi:MAG: ATP-binding protein [Bacteroidales bacterium]|nr:ATP-binding protein [Bacteroidales bacterium]